MRGSGECCGLKEPPRGSAAQAAALLAYRACAEPVRAIAALIEYLPGPATYSSRAPPMILMLL